MEYATAKDRNKFRQSEAWQNFRRLMMGRSCFTCEFCGKQYKNISELNIHHKYISGYDVLLSERFLVLCKACHEFIHLKYKAPAFAHLNLYGLVD